MADTVINLVTEDELTSKLTEVYEDIAEATPEDYNEVKAQVQQNTTDIGTNTQAITGINSKIPAQASAQNQLADKEFVNSSIQTNTATFRGTYNLVTDLGLTVSATEEQTAAAIATHLASLVPPVVPENNDYVFVQIPRATEDPADFDPTVIVRYDRYKCTVEEAGGVVTRTWAFEFSLNNSSFTADQWAAINSGITSALVTKLGALPTAVELAAALLGKADKVANATSGNLAGLDGNGNLTDSGKKPTDFAPATNIAKSALASDVQTSLGKADTAIQGVKVNGSALTPDGNKSVDVPVPVKATSAPQMAGEAAIGDSAKFAAENHVHPAETKIAAYALPDECFPITYTVDGTGYSISSNAELSYDVSTFYISVLDVANANRIAGFDKDPPYVYQTVGGTNIEALKFNGVAPVASTSPTLRDDAVYVRDVQVAKESDVAADALAVKTALALKANDADVLKNSGNQTLDGTLTVQTNNLPDGSERLRAGDFGFDYDGTIHYHHDSDTEYLLQAPRASGILALLQDTMRFSSEASYAVGDVVFYSGAFYRCTTAHTGDWNASHFAEVIGGLSTGTPTAPTPTAGDDSTKVATTAFVKTAIENAEPDLDYVMRVDPATGGIYYTTPDTNA